MNAKQIWQSTLERIQPKISPATFTTWFTGTSGVRLEDHLLTVCVPNTFSRAHLENRFYDLICSVLHDLIGSDAEVRFEVGQAEDWIEAAKNGTVAPRTVEATAHHVQALPLEDLSEQESLPAQRPPVLMTVAAARRERVEVAQEGRRLARRASPYVGELLPVVDAPVAAPLLTRITPVADELVSETAPAALHEQSAEEDRPTPPIVESIKPLTASS